MEEMNIRKVLVVFVICLMAMFFMAACHNSIPCPVYAQDELHEDYLLHS